LARGPLNMGFAILPLFTTIHFSINIIKKKRHATI